MNESGVTVRAIVLSRFALDGGAMHGIVPRTLWERTHPADERHRIALVARAIVVDHRTSGARTLVEIGMGQRWTDKERFLYALEEGPDAPEVLRQAGIDPDTITHVVITHAHFDHAGGLLRQSERDSPPLAFPRAEHVFGAIALAHARAPSSKDAGSFRAGDLEIVLRTARVRVWHEGEPLAPGLEGRLSHGHTEGLVVPVVPERDDGPPLLFPTDLIPTRSHLRPNWVPAYDVDPRRAIDEKRSLIADLVAMRGGVVLYHDPVVEAAWAVPSPDGGKLVPGRLDGSATG